MRSYLKPVLTCYGNPSVGYTSASNSNAVCQANCTLDGVCDLVADCGTPACTACDTLDTCATGINPAVECFPAC